jgi:hypothetical protein
MWRSENLDGLNGGGWGVFIASNHFLAIGWLCCRRAHRTVRWCTRHSSIHCPVSATSANRWGLEFLNVEVLCPLAASDSPVAHRTVWCILTLQFWLLHCSLFLRQHSRPLAKLTIAPLAHRAVRCTPDSQVNYSGVPLRKTQERPVREVRRPGHQTVSEAPLGCINTCFCSKLCRVPQLIFFIGLCWTLCTWGKWQLGKLVSPRGLWWTSNTKIDYRKCLKPISLSISPFLVIDANTNQSKYKV